MSLTRIATLLFLSSLAAFGQTYNYTASQSTSLSAAAEVVTVQLGTAPLRKVTFSAASVYCSVACTFTVERDGTAATATSLTINPIDAFSPSSSATAWHSSNAGSGTVLSQYTLAAGQLVVIDLSQKRLVAAGQNLSIRTSSITGTAQINIQWSEQ